MSTSAPEYLTTIRDTWAQAMQQWVDQSTSAWDQWSQAWSTGSVPGMPAGLAGAPGGGPSRGAREHEHRRHRHAHDRDCCGDACACCVPEADVIVHARAGELRVVPFRLRNAWRREREVTLEVGPWHLCGGQDLQVRAVLEEQKIVLAPCEDRVVRLLVSVHGAATTVDPKTQPSQASGEQTGKQGGQADNTDAYRNADLLNHSVVDVGECASAYADVRFEGCARPQRVAVVVSPADCDSVDVCCDCGCC
jgi:hypothetical protein